MAPRCVGGNGAASLAQRIEERQRTRGGADGPGRADQLVELGERGGVHHPSLLVRVTITTHLLLAALIEAGLLAASDPEPDRALARIEPELTRLLNGLRTP